MRAVTREKGSKFSVDESSNKEKGRWFSVEESSTLHYLINVHGRLLFSEKISRVSAFIRWWTLINFLAKFQGGRLFQCGRLLIFANLCVILEF